MKCPEFSIRMRIYGSHAIWAPWMLHWGRRGWHDHLVFGIAVWFGGMFHHRFSVVASWLQWKIYNWKFTTFFLRKISPSFKHLYLPKKPTQRAAHIDDWTGILGYWTVLRVRAKFVFCVGVRNFLGLLVIWISDGIRAEKLWVTYPCVVVGWAFFFRDSNFPGIHQDGENVYKRLANNDDMSSSYLWLYFNDMKI